MLPNATLLEEAFTLGLFVASGFTLTASLRAWQRIRAVTVRADRRAAIGWFRTRALLLALTLLTLWAGVLSLFTAPGVPPPAWVTHVIPWYRWAGIAVVSALIVDAIWTGFEDRQFALEFDPQTEARLDAGNGT